MTLWQAYLLFLSRFGLAPRPDAADVPAAAPSLRSSVALDAAQFSAWPRLGLPLGFALALAGQWNLLRFRESPLTGAALLAAGAILFLMAVWKSGIESGTASTAQAESLTLPGLHAPTKSGARWRVAGVAFVLSALTFLLVGGNNFSLAGRITWVASLLAWVAAFWEGPIPVNLPGSSDFSRFLTTKVVTTIQLSRTALLLCVVLIVSAGFRFARLNDVPIAMTSDHVEKLRDVNEILNLGRRPIFEAANAGREPMEFYLAALVAEYAGTGLSHLTLKLVTAAAGFLTLPFIFLFAREVSDDDWTALLAALAAGIGWWPNVISRNGLRFPFAPLFAALALWLIVRALKQNRRNDALLAGLALGIGLYGYTPVRIVPVAIVFALGLYALHKWRKAETIKVAGWLAMLSLVAVAAFVPMIRYAVDEPENFWRRTFTRITGDPEQPAAPTWQVLLQNEWNSLRMFSWTSDSAWLVSPAGQPALDWIMGACFTLGIAFLLYLYVRRRDWLDLFLVISIPLLLLPSTLALAFPIENPSLHRSGSAIPIVFFVVALPLRLLIKSSNDFSRFSATKVATTSWERWLSAALAALLLIFSAQENWKILFVNYAGQYKSSVQNAPELGEIVRGWVTSVGAWDTVFVRAYPYWVDTRAVGIYAGKFGWDNVILEADKLADAAGDPRPKLYILNRADADTVTALRELYPNGKLAYHTSQYHDKDFLTFSVPGTVDFDERLIVP